ncbi:MAG: DUF1467 family protein [Pseudomonadota bacterium]|nr:DUF1467 family protein [Pseudomonadota bacterium]
MSFTSALAIYFIIWWTVLFAVLPWGVRAQHEDGAMVPGSAESAPIRPLLLRKALATTVVAGIVFGLFYGLVVQRWISLDDVPFLPRYDGQ